MFSQNVAGYEANYCATKVQECRISVYVMY